MATITVRMNGLESLAVLGKKLACKLQDAAIPFDKIEAVFPSNSPLPGLFVVESVAGAQVVNLLLGDPEVEYVHAAAPRHMLSD